MRNKNPMLCSHARSKSKANPVCCQWVVRKSTVKCGMWGHVNCVCCCEGQPSRGMALRKKEKSLRICLRGYQLLGWMRLKASRWLAEKMLSRFVLCLRNKWSIYWLMGERRELNPRMVDSQSTALIHLATSAPTLPALHFILFHCHKTY